MRKTLFLAYAQSDRKRAAKVAKQLKATGFDLWSDSDLRAGDRWELTIAEQLRTADAIVLLASPAARESKWVQRELEYARASTTPVVPILMDGEPLPELADIQHTRTAPDGELPQAAIEAIQDALGQQPSRPVTTPVVAGVLEALDNRRLGNVLDELQRSVVLLLGNFSGDNLDRLLRLQGELQGRGLYPVIFDFERPPSSDFGETVRLLAGLAGFVIADMSNPRSVVMELQLIAPDLAVPIVPLIGPGHVPVALFTDLLSKYDWVLPPRRYRDLEHLVSQLDTEVIQPAMSKRTELRDRKKASAAAQVDL